ncbi:hypothetical protein WJX72_012277 [[Myrmecia] bisecta]|uniref:DNA polymerase zeta catalytic subunit n=1 Tax=[Myrmecia] bisecta TaxID=41462 RepID=A0AAW1RAB3_9CHLO
MPAQPEFVVRIVSIDYYLTRPTIGVDLCYSHLEGTTIEQVPVIRIFGATPTGQKTCLHLHKAFPYFYVAYQEALPSDAAAVQAYLRRMAQSIEAAMRGAAAPGAPRRQHVYSVQLVRGRAFYGYHADEQLFIKIILFNPMEVGKVAALMQNGAVLGRSFQPHEAHVPYLLQLKVDFNLYGMGYMRMKRVLFRGSVPEHHQRERTGWRAKPVVVQFEDGSIGSQEFGPSPHVPLGAAQSDLPASQQPPAYWTASTVPSDWLWERAGAGARVPEKLSCCELEVDACVEDILNRQELVRVPLDDAPDELRLVESLAPIQQDPAQPLQELDPHVREVMEWMQQHADSDREEEEDYLMLLANQAITQRGEASQGVTQQDMLQRAQAAATSLASQSQHEVEAILECSQPVQPDYDDGQEEVQAPATSPNLMEQAILVQPALRPVGGALHDMVPYPFAHHKALRLLARGRDRQSQRLGDQMVPLAA